MLDATPAETLHRRTCPLCEGMCGITVTREGNRVTAIRPDKDNVWSRGHMCPKGTTLGELHDDPDRIRVPMIREGERWREASWDEAFAQIETLVAETRARRGEARIASYTGNMSGKGYDAGRYMMLLHGLARFAQSYSSSTVDQQPKNVSAFLMYGNMWKIPIPDVDQTDLLVVIGGNPAESKGSLFSHRDVMGAIRSLRARGGKVIVIDPVQTRTAEAADAWIPIRPGADAALLLGVLHVLFAEDRVTLGALDGLVEGMDVLRDVASRFAPERVAAFCGIEASAIRELAHAISDAPRAAIYGRIGTCTQSFGTLASWLVDALAIATGNMDRVGGLMWSTQVAPHLDLMPPYPATGSVMGPASRVRGVASVLGQYPSSCLAEEIDTEGPGQIHGLVSLGANPVLSAPGSERLDAALAGLDVMVSLDIYVNETTRHAHVILPSPSLLSQAHWDMWAWPWALTSGGHYSPPLFEDTDRPQEWEVMIRLGAILGGHRDPDLAALDDNYFGGMCDAVGIDRAVAFEALPDHGSERILDLCIRTGPFGDRFGANPDGLTLAHFKAEPGGMLFGPARPQGRAAISTPSGKIEIAHTHFLQDLVRLEDALTHAVPELVLVSRRQLRSLNSWMHNIGSLVSGKPRCTLQIHENDAARLGIRPGQDVRITSQAGSIVAPAEITRKIRPGVVSLPHGWGHEPQDIRLDVAKRHQGSNFNALAPANMIDPASGNAVVNGIPVDVLPA